MRNREEQHRIFWWLQQFCENRFPNLYSAYGAHKGPIITEAILLFSHIKADWVSRQHWHSNKKIIPPTPHDGERGFTVVEKK